MSAELSLPDDYQTAPLDEVDPAVVEALIETLVAAGEIEPE